NSKAKEKPGQKPPPPPEKELLKVEPAPAQTPADKSPQKLVPPTESSGDKQKPGTEVDERQQLIINTDLITFNVTVTDIYGRFVSGLGNDAFTIFDVKQPQDITFHSYERPSGS